MQTGRNETCPCGSGKKFKNCCIGEASRRAARGPVVLIAAIGVIAAAGVLPSILGDKTETRSAMQTAAPATSTAGKVWSAEHNHWHDAAAPATTSPIQASTAPIRPASAPASAQSFTPKAQPPGPVPAGKKWSTEHGHWHDVTPARK